MLDLGWGLSGRPNSYRLAGIALLWMRLGERSARVGRVERAVAAGAEAVRTYRWLAADNEVYVVHLADALRLQAAHLHHAYQTDQAIVAGVEAVALYRRCTRKDPSTALCVARTLHELAGMLTAAGRDPEALAAAAEAVQVHRHIAEHDPGIAMPLELAALQAFLDGGDALPELDDAPIPGPEGDARGLCVMADTLANLALRLDEAGRFGDAQEVASEALMLYDVLVDIRDEALVARARRIARDLTPLERATDLIRIGIDAAEPAGAVWVDEAAVLAFRGLGGSRKVRAGLAMALNNLGNHLAAAGDQRGAIAVAQEAVAILREIDAPALAWAVANLGRHLRSAGGEEEPRAARGQQ